MTNILGLFATGDASQVGRKANAGITKVGTVDVGYQHSKHHSDQHYDALW